MRLLALSLVLSGCADRPKPARDVAVPDAAPDAAPVVDAVVDAAVDAAPPDAGPRLRPATGPVQLTAAWRAGLSLAVTVRTEIVAGPAQEEWTLRYRVTTQRAGPALNIQRLDHAMAPREILHKSLYTTLLKDLLPHVGDLLLQPDLTVEVVGPWHEADETLRGLLLDAKGSPERVHMTLDGAQARYPTASASLFRQVVTELSGKTASSEGPLKVLGLLDCDAPEGCVVLELPGEPSLRLTTDPLTLIPRRVEVQTPHLRTVMEFALTSPTTGGGGLSAKIQALLEPPPAWAKEPKRAVKLTLAAREDATAEARAAAQAGLAARLKALGVEATVEPTAAGWTVSAKVGKTLAQVLAQTLPQQGRIAVAPVAVEAQRAVADAAYANAPPEVMDQMRVKEGQLYAPKRAMLEQAIPRFLEDGQTVAFEPVEGQWRAWIVGAGTLALSPPAEARAGRDPNSGRPVLSLTLSAADASRFGDFTARHVGQTALLLLDDRVLTAPRIMEPIRGGKLVLDTQDELLDHTVAAALSAPPLPWPLTLTQRR